MLEGGIVVKNGQYIIALWFKTASFASVTIRFLTSSGVSECASEQTSERGGARKQSEQCGASKQVSGVSKEANEQTDERVVHYLRLDFWLFRTTVQQRAKELRLG